MSPTTIKSELLHLFKRDCVSCDTADLTCKTCPSGQVCTLSVQTCDSCPQAKCVDSSSTGSGVNKGAIAGGVVGGVAGLALIVGFVLWYKFRYHRRNQRPFAEEKLPYGGESSIVYLMDEDEDEIDDDGDLDDGDFEEEAEAPQPTLAPRAASITSTSGTNSRRSNVIPIMLPIGNGQYRMSTADSQISGLPVIFNHGGSPAVLRDSIGFSELSVDSDSASTNQGLRTYDVALQGVPNIVDLNKDRKLDAITENEDPGNEPSLEGRVDRVPSTRAPSSRHSVRAPSTIGRRASSRKRMSVRSVDAALPDLPGSDVESCFDDSHAIQDPTNAPSRLSVAASSQYDACLPEEVKFYDPSLIQ